MTLFVFYTCSRIKEAFGNVKTTFLKASIAFTHEDQFCPASMVCYYVKAHQAQFVSQNHNQMHTEQETIEP